MYTAKKEFADAEDVLEQLYNGCDTVEFNHVDDVAGYAKAVTYEYLMLRAKYRELLRASGMADTDFGVPPHGFEFPKFDIRNKPK